jgi:hypothetical protein
MTKNIYVGNHPALAVEKDVLRPVLRGVTGVLGSPTGPELGRGFASASTGISPHGKTLLAWEQRGKDSGRPPWGWLLLGTMVLGIVY